MFAVKQATDFKILHLRDKCQFNPCLSKSMEMNCEINTYQFKLRYRIQNFTIEEWDPLLYGVERSDNHK